MTPVTGSKTTLQTMLNEIGTIYSRLEYRNVKIRLTRDVRAIVQQYTKDEELIRAVIAKENKEKPRLRGA